MIILDTNVLSETLHPTPSIRVLEWMRSERASAMFTTTITEAELPYGVALLPEGRRRQSLEAIVELIFAEDLAGRYCPSTAPQLANLPTLRQAGVAPGGRFPRQTRALLRSPAPAAPHWQRGTSGILPAAGWN